MVELIGRVRWGGVGESRNRYIGKDGEAELHSMHFSHAANYLYI